MVKYSRNIPKLFRRAFRKLRSSYEWSGLLRTWIASYMDLCICGFVQIYSLKFDSATRTISSIIAIIVVGLNLILPYLQEFTSKSI